MAHCTHPEGPALCKSPTCPGRIELQEMLKLNKNKTNLTLPEVETAEVSDIDVDALLDNDYKPNVPHDLLDVAYDIMNYCDDIEVLNHYHEGKEYLSLTDMLQNTKMFTNNCGPITWAVMENLNADMPEGYRVEDYILEYRQGVHVACLITDENGEQYVLDYTAKQYDSRLPCPLVEPKERWEAIIDKQVAILYNDTRVKYQ